jgi:hypothetical protein
LLHSHTDSGYTTNQTRIEQQEADDLLQGIAYAWKTANDPEGARFVGNVEVLWDARSRRSRCTGRGRLARPTSGRMPREIPAAREENGA